MAITRLGGANAISGAITSSNLPTGSILQVQSTFVNTAFVQAISAGTDTAINNMSVNITPSATSSKILLMARHMGESNAANQHNIMYFFFRGSTKINVGVANGSNPLGMHNNLMGNYTSDANSTQDGVSMFTIDSSHNSTSQLTYHIGMNCNSAISQFFTNRTVNSSTGDAYERLSSEIIAMEIKG